MGRLGPDRPYVLYSTAIFQVDKRLKAGRCGGDGDKGSVRAEGVHKQASNQFPDKSVPRLLADTRHKAQGRL
jgi:hypothetical protein